MQDIFKKFSTPAKEVLFRAQGLAKRLGVLEIRPEHLLRALINQKNGLSGEILKRAGFRQKSGREEMTASKKEVPWQEYKLPSDTRIRIERRVGDLRELEQDLLDWLQEPLNGVLEIANKNQGEGEEKIKTSENKNQGENEGAIKLENLKFEGASQKIIERATAAAARFGHPYVGSEHLLWGILETEDETVAKIFEINRIDRRRLENQIGVILASTSKFSDLTTPGKERNFIRQLAMGEITEEVSKTPALEAFATNLTDLNIQEKIDPVIGRDEEIERLINILSRRTKNNPILIGEPGVGKTAIVEGLAKKIIKGEVPDILIDKKIYNLDLGLLVAGTSFRGDFENRIKHIINEVKQEPEIILFIDELHNIIGAGSASGSLDAANILKPALSRGEIRCIGATTPQEYKKHIEPDPALERRFQPIFVRESTREETIDLILGIAENYEKYHQVKITREAIEAAIDLSSRYIQDKFLPDKAIDLIDEAASSKKVKKANTGYLKEIKQLKLKVSEVSVAKEECVRQERFNEAIKLKEEEEKIINRIIVLKEKQKKEGEKFFGQVTASDIILIISRITKIPRTQIAGTGRLGFNETGLLEKLAARIIGQAEVTGEIVQVIRKSLSGLAHPSRPLGSFMFLGPSGVGKTEMAKVLAQELFYDERALIRFDMSEFGEAFGVSKLIGAPAGYVGYRESGKLTEAVKNRPYSLVLFDEIEKAHKEVRNLLLQIMEEGRLTDATGREINFKNTIIVMTSNIGVSDLNRTQKIGFSSPGGLASGEGDEEYERVRTKVLENLKRDFEPEFLNRIDKTLIFRPLTREDMEKIVFLQIRELGGRLRERGLGLEISEEAKKFMARESFSPESGAREIRRKIADWVEGPLAEKLLGGEFGVGDVVKIEVGDGKIVLKK